MATRRELTESQRWTLVNALICYALDCETDAAAGLVAGAAQVAKDALALAELLEDAETIEVQP